MAPHHHHHDHHDHHDDHHDHHDHHDDHDDRDGRDGHDDHGHDDNTGRIIHSFEILLHQWLHQLQQCPGRLLSEEIHSFYIFIDSKLIHIQYDLIF